jgi:glycosyltransferase involved in cell wall biosynthesis
VVAGTDVYRTRVAGETPAASAVYVVESFAQLLRAWPRVDVVHAHGALSPATIALAARALGKHCVVTILGAGPPGDLARLRRKPAGRLRLALLARFATFIALSGEVATELRAAGVPAPHVVVIANGVDLTEYSTPDTDFRAESRAELGLDPNRCYGIFVGRLHPVKSVDTLVRALVDTTGIDLLIVGDGQERARLERRPLVGRVARIRFIGSTPHVAKYLKVADAFFLPSLGEGMPNALLEAMACGLPCVASSSVGGVEELLGDAAASRSPSATCPRGVKSCSVSPVTLSCDTRWAKPPPVCASSSLHRCDSRSARRPLSRVGDETMSESILYIVSRSRRSPRPSS